MREQKVSERLRIIANFLAGVWPEQTYTLSAISGDASFRRYFRVSTAASAATSRHYVLMDAPPALEDCQRFIAVQQACHHAGLRVPEIVAADAAQGLLLLEDLGDQLLMQQLNHDNVRHWYQLALTQLADIRAIHVTSQGPLPLFDRAFLLREMQLFIDWFVIKHLQLELSPAETQMLQQQFELLADSALQQPQAGMHRDYHARNLMVLADEQLAVIDFQDMVLGPVSYDVVSLLKDCYIRWPQALVQELATAYFLQLQQQGVYTADWTQARFLRSFDLMGLQRHLKVCGIFSRLYHRDQKTGYLPDLPRVLSYVLETASTYPECAALHQLLQSKILPRFREIS